MYLEERISKALDIAFTYGQVEGSHHKMWVIDQMVQALCDTSYEEWVNEYRGELIGDDEYEGYEYEWDQGIPP